MRSSTSSAPSLTDRPRSGSRRAGSSPRRSSIISGAGCATSAPVLCAQPVGGAIDYLIKDWASFARFLDDGRICLTNAAAECALRGITLGRKAWLFAGSDPGGARAAFMYTLIVTARLNEIDPQAWLADALARIGCLRAAQGSRRR